MIRCGTGARGWTARAAPSDPEVRFSRFFRREAPRKQSSLALPQIHAVLGGSLPRHREGNGGQRGEAEFFEEKDHVSLLTAWECLCFGRCRENAATKQEGICSKSFQNIGAGVDQGRDFTRPLRPKASFTSCLSLLIITVRRSAMAPTVWGTVLSVLCSSIILQSGLPCRGRLC